MENRLVVNKQILTGYIFLSISTLISLLYILKIDFNYQNNYDAYNYFWGYKYLLKNNYDLIEIEKYFGRYPEFIYPILLKLLTILGKIYKIKNFIFITSFITYSLLIYVYLNIEKIYNKNLSKNAIGLQLQLLSSIIPLGLTVQVSRQTFAFFIFISSLILLRRIKLISTIIPIVILIGTHLYSSGIIIVEYLTRKRKYLLLLLYISLIFLSYNYLIPKLSHYNVTTFRDDYASLDKYFLSSLVALILIKGISFIKDIRFLSFLLISIVYLIFSVSASIIRRILFGMGWFWIIIIGFQIIGNKQIILSKLRITFISSVLLFTKLIVYAIK